ncbi:hypothetical protein F5144DRAFT_247359 [Chaetomium tenue]|uniref:Uncharacterized protein n=1 Tax=Chaetomium tenue TaxID=1854479 RepID=A0ACB7PA05_9PEZI|nr:hypothetical protein F5144DRAFT_247359 [Chaetomium globosum]
MDSNPPPNIYIVGAQCTGKTTLVNNLRAHFYQSHFPHNSNSNSEHDNDNNNNNNKKNNKNSNNDDDNNNNANKNNINPPPHPPSPPPSPPSPPPAIITEVARTVLAIHHFTAQDVRIPARSLALQRLILEAQAAAEERALLGMTRTRTMTAAAEAGTMEVGKTDTEGTNDGGGSDCSSRPGWFISDRSGADPIAYALRYAGGEEARRALAGTAAWAGLRARMRRSLVVVCEAGAATAAAGWLRDDGVRLMPEDVDEWAGFHAAFCRMLEAEAVPYVVLGVGVGGREERVRFVLERWRERAAQV